MVKPQLNVSWVDMFGGVCTLRQKLTIMMNDLLSVNWVPISYINISEKYPQEVQIFESLSIYLLGSLVKEYRRKKEKTERKRNRRR